MSVSPISPWALVDQGALKHRYAGKCAPKCSCQHVVHPVPQRTNPQRSLETESNGLPCVRCEQDWAVFRLRKVRDTSKTSARADYQHRMVAPIPKRNETHEVPRLDETTVHMGGDGTHNESISCPISNLIGRMRPTRGEKDGWGTPFPIEWICTESLGFSRIKHIHNAWNNAVSFP